VKESLCILLVDDHAVVRRGLKQILADEWRQTSFGEAETAQEALALVRKQHWDVVLLDISMPGRSGLDVIQEIRKEESKLPILVLSGHPEEEYGIRVLKAGASGYLEKESAPDTLVDAVRRALRGERVLTPTLADRLVQSLGANPHQAAHEGLSDRELQVLRMIGAGRTVSQIAEELHLSDKTISTYRGRILEKLDLENNAQIMRYCLDHSLLD